MRILEYSNKYY